MQHQEYCIYWQLETERTPSRGGFFGDGMGLGKVSESRTGSRMWCRCAELCVRQQTMEALGLCVVKRWLHIAHTDVNRDRAAKDYTRHLRRGTENSPQTPGVQCPFAVTLAITLAITLAVDGSGGSGGRGGNEDNEVMGSGDNDIV